MFYNPKRYNLSVVGRMKLNQKFKLDIPLENRLLTMEDLTSVVRYLVDLRNNIGDIDDIDHLGNRRVRAVGESLENQFRVGLVRMERAIIERMSIQDLEVSMPLTSRPEVNSFHDFGIPSGGLGRHLRAIAHAPDGTVEAAEHRDLPHWGIMWHPERAPENSEDLELLRILFAGEAVRR